MILAINTAGLCISDGDGVCLEGRGEGSGEKF